MINRFVIGIPVFNNPETIIEVVRDCLKHTPFPVFIIDDGSDPSVEDLLMKNTVVSERITLFRHSKNRGKGEALKNCFSQAIKFGYTHVITIDGDGQHDPRDILKLAKKSETYCWSLVIGDRDMKTEMCLPQVFLEGNFQISG